jgi:hypothetical protein
MGPYPSLGGGPKKVVVSPRRGRQDVEVVASLRERLDDRITPGFSAPARAGGGLGGRIVTSEVRGLASRLDPDACSAGFPVGLESRAGAEGRQAGVSFWESAPGVVGDRASSASRA